jgi:hypothetical protein
VIVGDGTPTPAPEVALVAQVARLEPHPLHHLRSAIHGVSLLQDLEILIRDHVPQDGEQRPGVGGKTGGIVAGADQHVLSAVKVPVVLAIGEQQVHAHGRRLLLQGIRHAQQQRHPGSAVVRAGHRFPLVGEVGTLIRVRPRVPVGQVENPVAAGGQEAPDEIAQPQRVALSGDVGETLHVD